jgi:putative tryptophan/tyrosine transport system substrate-binding protein
MFGASSNNVFHWPLADIGFRVAHVRLRTKAAISQLCIKPVRWPGFWGVNMRRREFITVLGGAAASWPLSVRAQQRDEVRRIGVVVNVAVDDPEAQASVAAFKQTMQQLGWSEGRNLQVYFRGAAGDPERMQAIAKELVALNPHLILTRSTPVTEAFLRQSRTIPIVFTVVSDPVGERFVESLARPGGNATGFTNVESSLTGKWVELLKEVAPGVKRVAFLFNPKLAPGGGSYYTRLIEVTAPRFSITPTVAPINGAADIERAIGEFVREPNGGLVVLPDATTLVNRKLIVALADRHRLPAVYAFRIVVIDGGLMSYGIDIPDQYRQAAGYVDRILKGAKPAELPVQLPTKFVLSVNLKTAKALGLDVPSLLQQRADDLIE